MHPTLSYDVEDAQVLKNMGDHLHDLAEEMAQVAATVSQITARAGISPPLSAIQNLQKIDALQQSLSDVAHLSHAMACDRPAREAALQNLKLAATRALLCQDDQTKPAHSGSVDLF